MASTPGESRRRKNVDRGSDRLALITCQIHALPPGYPSQPLNSQDPPLHLSNKITDDHEPTTIAAGHGGRTVKPSSREFDTAAEASIASSAETSGKVESSLAKPSRSTSGTEQNLKQQRWISSSVTPNQITSAIAASEKSRLRCSVVVALSAVLSQTRISSAGQQLDKAFKGAVEAENKIPSTGGTDWTEQASEALKSEKCDILSINFTEKRREEKRCSGPRMQSTSATVEVFLNNPFLSQYMCIPFNLKSFWLPTRRRSRNNANVIRLNAHNLHLSTSTPDIVAVQDTVESCKELNQTKLSPFSYDPI
ncbi:hypothetical protein H0E87_011830 [Populus deltoides]|uniref:Uncharacterized protein n=1 Tax=Populus deltoides TaxID=3696 RepID=A0A8T2YGP1_POPDE|nr:hypothetical protein H0E87_011830 [Populus deltoides]